MNTLEAFKEMININGMDKILRINHSTFHSYRRRINQGKEISYKTMETLLLKAGWENKGWIKKEDNPPKPPFGKERIIHLP